MTPILTVTLFFWTMVLASTLTFISDRPLRKRPVLLSITHKFHSDHDA